MKGPVVMAEQLFLDDQLFNMVIGVIGQTEGVESSFLRFQDLLENLLFRHPDIIMCRPDFLPKS